MPPRHAPPRFPATRALAASCGLACAGSDIAERQRCEVDKSDGCFLAIPGGAHLLGAQASDPSAPGYDPDARPEEGPVRRVTLPPFRLQEEEVHFTVWLRCVEAGACATAPDGGPVPGMGAARPFVAAVTWTEADALCRFLGGRLPTADEWEAAARGPEGRRFPWGEEPPCGLGTADYRFHAIPREAWSTIEGCGERPVDPRGRSPYGARDMAWGHWEWVADAATMPDGAPGRVQRGGSWVEADAADHRAVVRTVMPPDARIADVGVRCAF